MKKNIYICTQLKDRNPNFKDPWRFPLKQGRVCFRDHVETSIDNDIYLSRH